MLHTFFQTLPCFVCLILAFAYGAIKNKTRQQRYILEFLIVAASYYFTNMGLVLHTNSIHLDVLLYVNWVFSSLIALSILMVIICRETRVANLKLVQQAMFMVSFLITVSLATLFNCIFVEGETELITIPPDTSYLMYNDGLLDITYYIGKYAYVCTLLVFAAFCIAIETAYLYRRRKILAIALKEKSSLKEKDAKLLFTFGFIILSAISKLLGDKFPYSYPYLADLLSLAKSIMLGGAGFCGLINLRRDQSRFGGLVLDKEKEIIFEQKEAVMESKHDLAGSIESNSLTPQQEALFDRFNKFFEVGKAYLDPTMTIEKITNEINSNRTYVSTLVNKVYGMPFRDLINKRRLEEAKTVMKENPDWILEDIAVRAGFTSASQLSRKFKEEEGVTPREWINNNK